MNHVLFAMVALLWCGFMAICALGFQLVGWIKLKQHPLTLGMLVLSMISPPLGGLFLLVRPHSARIVALFHPVKSPPIVLPAGCSFFPQDNIWDANVRSLPPDSESALYVDTIGYNTPLHADFGSAAGYEYSVVETNEKPADIAFLESPTESDRGPYRLPDNAPVERGSDRHVLAVDPAHCQLYELFDATRIGDHRWEAGSGAIFDLASDRLRPDGWTSADAAGLPILAGLVRYDEVAAGSIQHALRFTASKTRSAYVWPARHRASSSTNPTFPPMGERFRLRTSFDTAGFSAEAKVILNALKNYGMILADNGGPWFLSGARDSRWPSALGSELRRVHGSDFEAVDVSLLMITENSAQARHYNYSDK